MTRARYLLAVVMILAVFAPAVTGRRRRPPAPVQRREVMPPPMKLTPEQRKQVGVVVGGGNDFAMDLYAKLAPDNKGNMFFSPASIHTALAMASAGAGGTTGKQMSSTLHLDQAGAETHESLGLLTRKLNSPPRDLSENPMYELTMINALWGDKNYRFAPEFTTLIKEQYGAGMRIVDFRLAEPVRKAINDWAATKTRRKIMDLIPQGMITPRTRLVLTNAIYFKSNWAYPFKESATAGGEFRAPEGKGVRAQMMNQQHRFSYYETADFQLLRLPYNRWALSMLIILPKKDDDLARVEKQLTTKNLSTWMDKLRTHDVKITLPRFTFASQFKLTDTLKAMGMTEPFSMGADFSGMAKTKKKDLYISDVVHKAFVTLDEAGTEAAAATAVMMALKSALRPMTPKVFKADHPFIFIIRHRETESVLFMGRVADPTAE